MELTVEAAADARHNELMGKVREDEEHRWIATNITDG